ncbi:MAG: PD-(D/E)XK nuclease family protein [Myxococcales bacterium]|nr:PD-(D/E)XK nuclease family protein [Myxococcales bacterium]
MSIGPIWTEGSGVLPTWERLLADVVDEVHQANAEMALLSRPIWVVVSSALLRARLAENIARRAGGCALGVSVLTLRGAAMAVLRQCGLSAEESALLFGVIVRREAAREPVFQRVLAEFDDGFRALLDPVRDLIDAGWEPELLGGALDWAEESLTPSEREHVIALLKTTDRVRKTSLCHRVVRTTDLLTQAADLLVTHPNPINARSVFVYGIGDATGRAMDFLERLLRRVPTKIYLETPHDPALPGAPDAGIRYTRRFSGRLKPLCNTDFRPPYAAPDASLCTFDAAGEDAEVRTVARRVRLLLDNGVPAESIVVVARTLEPYLTVVRFHFNQYGIPFSIPGEKLPELFPEARTIAAFVELLSRGKDTPVATWIDAIFPTMTMGEFLPNVVSQTPPADFRFPLPTLSDLRLALTTLAAHTLFDVARLSDSQVEQDTTLPIRLGLVDTDDETVESYGGPKAVGRKIKAEILSAVRTKARTLVGQFDDWPASASFAEHALRTRALTDEFGQPDNPLTSDLRATIDSVGRLAPTVDDFTRAEFLIPLRTATAGLGQQPLAGAGAGVQVLGAARARGVVAEHLFVMGLNVGRFPRVIREDPLLPDPIRIKLAQLLPDIPIKSLGHDEERFLFAQCLSAAPNITLSWLRADADGRELSPSVLIERLRINRPGIPHAIIPRDARRAVEDVDAHSCSVLSAYESSLYAALVGDRSALVPLLPHVWGVGDKSLSSHLVASGRIQVLDEVEPDKRTEAGRRSWPHLSPYMGLVGPLGGFGNQISVTVLEQFAACPWQTFLTRVLRLEPPPEYRAIPPGISANLIGNTVHLALQMIVDRAVAEAGQTETPWIHRQGIAVPWPRPPELAEICFSAAEKAAVDAHLRLTGFVRILAELAQPYLNEAAQLICGGDETRTTLGAEVDGVVALQDDRQRTAVVRFRADRADRVAQTIELIDYKTGKPAIDAVKQDVRNKHLATKLSRGALLQGAVYSLAGGGAGVGTYAYLRPELEERKRLIQISADDTSLMDIFVQTVAVLLGGMVDGAMFPRLELANGDENPRCEYCPVTEACNRGDSGSRRRLHEWVSTHRDQETPPTPAGVPTLAHRLGELWWLGGTE